MHNLKKQLYQEEDNFTERKPDGVNAQEIRKTLVAFANSVPEGQEAVLFIGIRDNGDIQGVTNTDKLQKTIREVCEKQCYPQIKYRTEVIEENKKQILAVFIPYSTLKPHFAGPSYISVDSA